MTILENLDQHIQNAIDHFWSTRMSQIQKQQASGRNDAGTRGAVTGGKQMSAFEHLAVSLALERGIPESSIFYSSALELPGYFCPEKFSGGTLASGGTCKLQVTVVGAQGGNQINTIAANSVISDQGDSNTQPSDRTLQVSGLNAIGTVVSFTPNDIPAKGRTTFRMLIMLDKP